MTEFQKDIRRVDIVDSLMMHHRNGIEPSAELKLEAYELGINVSALHQTLEAVDEQTDSEDNEESEGY